MEPVQAPTEGATGEPTPAPVAAGSQDGINLDELVDSLPAPAKAAPAGKELDADFLQKLESLDPGALPEGLRGKLEKPFLSQYGKKTTEWDGERQRLLGMIERLTNQPKAGVEPSVDEKELLRQRIADGDVAAIEQLVDQRFETKYGSAIEGVKMDTVYRAAHQNFPEIATMEPQVAEVLKANPGVSFVIKSVTQRDPQLAGLLLAGVAKNISYDNLKQQYDALKGAQKQIALQAIEEYKKRIAGLPSSGFRGGTTPTGGPAPTNMSLRDSLEAAWNEHGGS